MYSHIHIEVKLDFAYSLSFKVSIKAIINMFVIN